MPTEPPSLGPHPDPAKTHATPFDAGGFAWVGSLWRDARGFLRPHIGALVVVGVLMTIELLMNVANRKAMSYLIDEAVLKSNFNLLMLIIGLLFLAAIIAGTVALAYEYMYSTLCSKIPGEVRTILFNHVQLLPLGRLRTSRHGDLVTRIAYDSGAIEPALWSIGYMALAAGGAVFATIMLAITDWRLTLVGLALLPLTLIGPRILSPKAAKASYSEKNQTGDLATHLQENLANQIVLRVFGMRKVAGERFAAKNASIVEVGRKYNVYSYYSHRVPAIVIEFIELIVLALGGWLVVRGEMTPGNLVAFYLLYSGLCGNVWSLTASVPGLIGASTGLRRVQEVLTEPIADRREAAGEKFTSLGEGVRFENVVFSYDGERNQLDHVSLEVPRGEVVAFVGSSGSGKSTALQLLLGLQAPKSGRVLVGGRNLAAMSLDDYWSHISAVFQDSLLFHASIADNIRAGKQDATDDEIRRAARAAEIADWIETLPEGYRTIVAGDTCSGGQRQRLALARALIRDPQVLVLDEPTSALDPASGSAVMATLRKVAQGRTVVLVTHQLRDAASAARIVVFDSGKVAEVGTQSELLGREGTYAELWARQTRDTSG